MGRCYCFSEPKRMGGEIDGGFRARAGDATRPTDSEMAPQALERAQNGLGNGAAGSPLPRRRTDRPNSHQLADLEEEPAKGREADGPEKHDGGQGIPRD
jgi:hypothetical protein